MAAHKRLAILTSAILVLLQPVSGRAKDVGKPDSDNKLKPAYAWRQADGSLALLNHGRVVWQLNCDKKEGKPYFHPVCLTDGVGSECIKDSLTTLGRLLMPKNIA